MVELGLQLRLYGRRIRLGWHDIDSCQQSLPFLLIQVQIGFKGILDLTVGRTRGGVFEPLSRFCHIASRLLDAQRGAGTACWGVRRRNQKTCCFRWDLTAGQTNEPDSQGLPHLRAQVGQVGCRVERVFGLQHGIGLATDLKAHVVQCFDADSKVTGAAAADSPEQAKPNLVEIARHRTGCAEGGDAGGIHGHLLPECASSQRCPRAVRR